MKRIVFICLIVVVLISGCMVDPINEEDERRLSVCEWVSKVPDFSGQYPAYICKFYDGDNVCYITKTIRDAVSMDCLKVKNE